MFYMPDPTDRFGETFLNYERYLETAKADGQKPVSFLRFLTGRY